MVATLAHNINQPLTAASAYLRAAQRLTGGLPKEPATPIVETLDKAVTQIVRAAEAVRALSELFTDSGPEKTPVSLNLLIEETLSFIASEAADAGVSISKRLTKDDDCIVADRFQIKHVLINLIQIAMERMQKTPRRELFVSTTTEAASAIRLTIQDGAGGSGEGEDADLFAFFAAQEKGMGIGLSISRTIVEAHHGRLWARANPERSAIFSCDLPLRGQESKG
ncbi:ATP-binding protein [Methylocystis sp. B8]|nr:ATP-binding protein [Methylocystis sp. B8]